MEFRRFAAKHFRATIVAMTDQEISSELRWRLVSGNHPRINLLLDNLARELYNVQLIQVKRGQKPHTLSDLAWSVKEMTKVFVHGIELEATKMYKTEAARLLEQKKAQEEADMQSTLEGKPQGAFEEMGLVIEDKSTAIGT